MQIGQKIIRLDSVDSTNNYTANLIKVGGLVSGAVIMADEQFAGKGQRGAVWLTKPGENLTFSVFLDNVNLSVDRQFVLTQFISLVLVELLDRFGIEAKIKWPNDIFVRSKKIAGVLIENQLSESTIGRSIIGIGLNVNQMDFGNLSATSIKTETGRSVILMDMLFSFIETFNRHSVLFNSTKRDLLDEKYKTLLYRLGEKANFEDGSGVFTGEIKGVTKEGKLQIQKEDGLHTYQLKEVKFL